MKLTYHDQYVDELIDSAYENRGEKMLSLIKEVMENIPDDRMVTLSIVKGNYGLSVFTVKTGHFVPELEDKNMTIEEKILATAALDIGLLKS